MKVLISAREVMDMLGISRTTLWRWQQDRNFPDTILRGRYSGNDVLKWAIDNKIVRNEAELLGISDSSLEIETAENPSYDQEVEQEEAQKGRLIMAITLRPTDSEEKLLKYAKQVTGESTASKSVFSLIINHQAISDELKRYKQLEREANQRARTAESAIDSLNRSLSTIASFTKE